MAKNDGTQLPSSTQALTLRLFHEGWELIISEWCDASYNIMLEAAKKRRRKTPSRERIYWRKHKPEFKLYPWDTMDCGNPRMKRHHMSHMERYGWVIQHKDCWTITEAGQQAYQRHLDWFNEATKKFNESTKKGI